MVTNVAIQQTPARRVAAIRHVGAYSDIGQVFARLFGWAWPKGLVGASTETIGIYYDDPRSTPKEKLRSDAGITVGADFKGDPGAGVNVVEIAGGRCVVATHKGPYSELESSYLWIMGQWMPANGAEPADAPSFEVYRNNPQTTPPQDLITDIHVPLKS
jgi:AraC family transcriptional regulator